MPSINVGTLQGTQSSRQSKLSLLHKKKPRSPLAPGASLFRILLCGLEVVVQSDRGHRTAVVKVFVNERGVFRLEFFEPNVAVSGVERPEVIDRNLDTGSCMVADPVIRIVFGRRGSVNVRIVP